jgi:hypothetical protein
MQCTHARGCALFRCAAAHPLPRPSRKSAKCCGSDVHCCRAAPVLQGSPDFAQVRGGGRVVCAVGWLYNHHCEREKRLYNCDKKRANRPEESVVGRTPKRFTNLVTHSALGGLTEQKWETDIDCGPKRVVNLDI